MRDLEVEVSKPTSKGSLGFGLQSWKRRRVCEDLRMNRLDPESLSTGVSELVLFHGYFGVVHASSGYRCGAAAQLLYVLRKFSWSFPGVFLGFAGVFLRFSWEFPGFSRVFHVV